MRASGRSLMVVGALLAVALTGCDQGGNESTVTLSGTAPPTPLGSGVPQAPSASSSTEPPTTPPTTGPTTGAPTGPPKVVGTIATGLTAPWGLDFFTNGDAVVTERDSKRVLLVSGPDHEISELGVLDAAAPDGEGGLLGVAVSPDFDRDRTLYFYLTTATDNRIVRARVQRGGTLGAPQVLLDGIPDAAIHDGGRLAFGPDGYLYASTGESGRPELAPDLDSLGGKILRITTDGDPAPGNPFDSPVWSYGHRNVQGLAFDDDGRLWASEFGQDTFDELNLIRKGRDYGWPAVEGAGGEPDHTDPERTWATDDASPSGLAYVDGTLWMGALRGERLWQIPLRGATTKKPTAYFIGDYGRMRTVALAPDGTLWVTTSNRDGRGDPRSGDDRILQVRP
ncbi:PQQ-dependent sugar dehydrogenase [soil metagenome]